MHVSMYMHTCMSSMYVSVHVESCVCALQNKYTAFQIYMQKCLPDSWPVAESCAGHVCHCMSWFNQNMFVHVCVSHVFLGVCFYYLSQQRTLSVGNAGDSASLCRVEFEQRKTGSTNIAVCVNHAWCMKRKRDGQLPRIQYVVFNIYFRKSWLHTRFLPAHVCSIGSRCSTWLSTCCLATCGSDQK